MKTKIHELKTWPQFFNKMWNDEKPFELRKNDRNFMEGDICLFWEHNNISQQYSGRLIIAKIGYILRGVPNFGLMEGYVIFAFNIIEKVDSQ